MLRMGWGALALVVGCAAAENRRSESARTAPSSAPTVDANCSAAGSLAGAALNAGNLLAARRLAGRAAGTCAEVEAAVLSELSAILRDAQPTTSDALLAEAARARNNGQLQQARKLETRAVEQLEQELGERLRVRQRWALQGLLSDSRADETKAANSRFALMRDDSEIQLLDMQTGRLRTRIALPRREGKVPEFQVEVSPSGRRVVVRTVDRDAVSDENGKRCFSKLHFYDGDSGVLLKEECAMHWQFTPDGSRLLLARLLRMRIDSPVVMQLEVLDSESLQSLYQVTAPKGQSEESSVDSLHVAASGRAFAARWSSGVTVTDLDSGRSEASVLDERNIASPPQFGGDRVTWLTGGRAFTLSLSTHRLDSWSLGHKKPCTGAALNDDGTTLAVDCDDHVALYDVGKRQLTASVRTAHGQRVFRLKWLSGGRNVAVLLGSGRGQWALLDARKGSWVTLAGPSERLQQFRPAERLALLGSNSPQADKAKRLVYVDSQGVPREIPAGDCWPLEIGYGSESTAVASCRGTNDLTALLIDRSTLETRTWRVGAPSMSVYGNTLLVHGDATFELRDLTTGMLRDGSPVGPAATRTDGFWDERSFVSRVLIGEDEQFRVTDFAPRLRTTREPVRKDGPCATGRRRGKWVWSIQQTPAPVCERRSGRRVAEVSSELVTNTGLARLDVNEDRQLALLSAHEPRVVRLSSGASVELQGGPLHLGFASAHLVYGLDAKGGWGLWSGDTGQRLVRSEEALSDSIILADEELGVLVEGGRRPKIRNFQDGKERAELPVDARGEMALTRGGVLSVVERARVSFWNVRSGQRLGQLLHHPNAEGSAFVAESGEFETSNDPNAFRDVLRCEVGLKELPFEICIDAWFEPGAAARSLAQ